MAHIVFVNPAYGAGYYSRASRSPAVAKSGTVYYPYWLCYAAGWAEDHGHKADIIDAATKRMTHTYVVEELCIKHPELVVLDTTTPSIASDLNLARMIRQRLPDTPILAVGTHVSALANHVLEQEPAITAIARGEYDLTVSEYANNLTALEKVAGLTYRNGSEICSTPDRELIKNLDSLPFVTRVYKNHLDVRDYFWSTAHNPMVMIITGRGCPNKCSWCLYPQTMHGRGFRYRSPENVVDEFEYVRKELPSVREIGIEDDTFTAHKGRAQEICELLLKRNIHMRWWANVRANLDLETMELMKRAGCRLLIVGFEAGCQEVLDAINKGIKLEHIEKFMENAHKLGIPVRACFVVGQPGETEASMNATLNLAVRLDPDTAQFFPMIVYPGTEAYAWAKEKGYLITEDYSKWLTPGGNHNSVIRTQNLKPEQVMAFVNHATRSFYLRPRVIARTIFNGLTSYQEFKRITRTMSHFWKFLFR